MRYDSSDVIRRRLPRSDASTTRRQRDQVLVAADKLRLSLVGSLREYALAEERVRASASTPRPAARPPVRPPVLLPFCLSTCLSCTHAYEQVVR